MKNTISIKRMIINMFCELDIKIWGKVSEDTLNIAKVQNMKIPKRYLSKINNTKV